MMLINVQTEELEEIRKNIEKELILRGRIREGKRLDMKWIKLYQELERKEEIKHILEMDTSVLVIVKQEIDAELDHRRVIRLMAELELEIESESLEF